MPNSFFQFKQFRVEQELCAMKVCTDSCVFGAAVVVEGAERILDIGTGTGLLALMVAQRSEAEIDAVEINAEAQEQAAQNFRRSPWAERLQLHPVSLQRFATQQKYDLILSNPPFFQSSLRSGNEAKNTAKHTGDLFFEDILSFTQQHLKPTGKLCLLLPPAEAQHVAQLATTHQLHLTDVLEVFTRDGGKCIRHIQTYSFSEVAAPATRILHIREKDAVTYSQGFTKLLQEFYLNF